VTFGINVFNEDGEVVIDTENPTQVLLNETSVTGSEQEPGLYKFPQLSSGQIRFWKMSVGDGIASAPGFFLGNKQTFTVRDTVPVSDTPAPTGYGVVVYDSSGSKVFSASSETIPIGDLLFVEKSGATASTSDEWVSIQSPGISIVPEQIPGQPIQYKVLAGGVFRDSLSEYSDYSPQFALGNPSDINTNPTYFITAK